MAKHKPTITDLSAQSVALAEFAAKALVAAEQLASKRKPSKTSLSTKPSEPLLPIFPAYPPR